MNVVKAGEILKIKTGKYDANHSKTDGKYTFFTCADIPSKANTYSFNDEVLILPGNGANVGKVYHYKGKLEAYQRTYVLFEIKACPKFLYYYFSKYWIRQITKRQVGSATNYIKMDDIVSFEIPLPPLATQQRIATILDDAAALRDKTKQLLTQYDLLAQSIFLEMFGDPVINPKGWEIKKLGDLGKWQSGGTPSRNIKEYYKGDIPWLSSGELNEMYISDSKEHINEQALKKSSAKLVPEGSLLLGMYDSAALKSTINTKDLACNQAIAFGILDEKLVNTVYGYSIIQIGKEHFKRIQRGARQKNLNLSLVKAIKIMCPPIHLQNQFAEKIALIEQQKALAKQELQESENLFNCLLQKAFKGELG